MYHLARSVILPSALPVPATPSPGTLLNGFRSKGPVLELVTVDLEPASPRAAAVRRSSAAAAAAAASAGAVG